MGESAAHASSPWLLAHSPSLVCSDGNVWQVLLHAVRVGDRWGMWAELDVNPMLLGRRILMNLGGREQCMVRVYVMWGNYGRTLRFRTQIQSMEGNARGSWEESRYGCAGRTAQEYRGVGGDAVDRSVYLVRVRNRCRRSTHAFDELDDELR